MSKRINKKSFVLITTILLVIVFSILSVSIIESNMISSNLNKLKYLHLQANIHIKNVEKYILLNSYEDIMKYTIKDDRFFLKIVSKNEDNKTIYYINIKTIDDTPISVNKMANQFNK